MIAISCSIAFLTTWGAISLGHVERPNQGDWRQGVLSGLLVAIVVGVVGQQIFQHLNRREPRGPAAADVDRP